MINTKTTLGKLLMCTRLSKLRKIWKIKLSNKGNSNQKHAADEQIQFDYSYSYYFDWTGFQQLKSTNPSVIKLY